MITVGGTPYAALAALLVASGVLLGLCGAERAIGAALLLMGCLSAIAALGGAGPTR
jgi:hypothetical protein